MRNDAGVYIWDLEAGKAASSGQMHLQSGIARSLAGGAHPHPSPSLHPHTPFGSAVPLPLGPADPVVSLAFLSPHLIVAGVPGKGIRGWDLRNPHSGGSPNFAIATKAVYGLAADPWSNHRVAGFGDDGVVRIFDLRRGAVAPGAPYPTAASSEPLLALPTSDIFPKGVSQLSWSLARSGMLAASGLGASAVRVWDVREAGGAASAPDGAGQPVVWRTKTIRTRNGVPITGMCFVPPLADPPGGMVAEPTPEQIDGSATGHRLIASLADDSIAILDVREAQRNAWGARGGNSMAWVGGRGIVCITEGVRTDAQAGVMTMGPGTTVPEADIPSMLGGDVAVVMRERAAAGYGVEPSSNLSLFERDPSSFGMDASHLADLWTFLLASKELNDSEGARTSDGRDWSFAGVAAVLERGYRIAGGKIDSNGASLAAIPITEQTKSAPILGKSITAQRLSSAPAFGALLEQNLQEGMDEFAAELALPDGSDGSATSDAGPVSRAGPIPDEYKKLALAMCGWWHLPGADGSTTTPPPYHMPSDDELEDALHEMELRGQFEKAAGWALFRGASFGRAIKSLRSSNEERLKLVAAALSAALPAPSSSSPGGHAGVLVLSGNQLPPLFVDLCSSLATDLHDPYLRAMFALVASSGNWHVVLDEKELPLRDRVGVAIRFLPDEQLLAYVRRTRAVMVQSGSVEGLLLTGICTPDGLARDGVQLLQTYVDRTADVQTASLATAMVIPGRFADRVVREWVDAYRSLLDRWEMFHERARFDIARGRYAGSATLRAAGGMGTPVLGPVGLNRENRGLDIPPQIAVRCNFCSASIQHKQNGSRRDFKAIACPNCRKPLPRCALCLLPMGTWPVNLDTVSGGLGGPFSDRGALTSAASSPANSPPKKDGPAPSQQMIAGLAGGVASAAKTSLLAGVGLKSQNSEVREKVGNPSALTGFDAWFTWCVVCRHGGHNAHVREWFAEYNICPVSGCGCKCGSL